MQVGLLLKDARQTADVGDRTQNLSAGSLSEQQNNY